jgi:hypothetical protein
MVDPGRVAPVRPNLAEPLPVWCPTCRASWIESDPVALAGARVGIGVRCPNCRAVTPCEGGARVAAKRPVGDRGGRTLVNRSLPRGAA